ncbi:MAG: hypothetical protein EOP81_11445 [Variovorax sp.]|nr:MAG: hypothetical protein EOP81_11445 [Variovorax sp.]
MNNISFVEILILVVSCVCTFTLARWLSRRRREDKRQRERKAEEATQSRQVRRARERRGG